jgi:aryl sulfotransferase
MKEHADQLLPRADHVWTGGPTTFVFQGTNGRWKGVLSPEELALYAHTVETVLPPACAAWLEHGRAALTSC